MPATLEDLKGLTAAKRLLKGVWASQAYSHSFLLYGGEGSGKTQLAKLIAGSFLCQHLSKNGPCGACQPCNAMSRGTNTDLLLIEPAGKSQLIKDSAITDGVPEEGTVGLRDFLRTGPLTSSHKVVLIEDADRMNSSAANALLKSLEEPPDRVVMILTTRDIGKVLPTILSRCVAVACEIPQEARSDWSDLAMPSIGTSARFNAHPELFERFRVFAQRLSTRPRAEALVAAEEFRALCGELEKAEDLTARQANAEGLTLLSHALVRNGNPEGARLAVETHRRIVGNGGAGLTFDAMFARLLNNR
ncbi:MAG TPA: AAA family ATPase [Fimbriimonadaceae bacterium]|nr:AAA family ATPase [Fimbriimonadaceae bacterium]